MARLTTDLSARLWSDGICTRWMTIRGFAYLTNSSSSSKLFRTRSRCYLCESFFRCLIPCHGGPTKCIYLFLPSCHRPPPEVEWVGFPLLTRKHDFLRTGFSRLQIFHNVQAPEFARLPDRSHRCAYSHRAAETFTSGQNVLRYLRTHRIY